MGILENVSDCSNMERAFDLVKKEYLRVAAMCSVEKFNSTHEAYAVLKEEVDELWDEVKSNVNEKDMETEAIQVATVAIRFIAELFYMRNHNPKTPF